MTLGYFLANGFTNTVVLYKRKEAKMKTTSLRGHTVLKLVLRTAAHGGLWGEELPGLWF